MIFSQYQICIKRGIITKNSYITTFISENSHQKSPTHPNQSIQIKKEKHITIAIGNTTLIFTTTSSGTIVSVDGRQNNQRSK